MALSELTERQRRQENIQNGVIVEGVDIIARQAGLRAGDIITEIDGKRVYDISGFQRLLAQVPSSPPCRWDSDGPRCSVSQSSTR